MPHFSKSALLETELCIHADAYMDAEMSEVPYAIVCKGCDPENVEKLEEALKNAFASIIETGNFSLSHRSCYPSARIFSP